jgi:hypothetical protein
MPFLKCYLVVFYRFSHADDLQYTCMTNVFSEGLSGARVIGILRSTSKCEDPIFKVKDRMLIGTATKDRWLGQREEIDTDTAKLTIEMYE